MSRSALVLLLLATQQSSWAWSCPDDISVFRTDRVLSSFDPSATGGLWYEQAYKDAAQLGESCQVFNNTFISEAEGIDQRFHVSGAALLTPECCTLTPPCNVSHRWTTLSSPTPCPSTTTRQIRPESSAAMLNVSPSPPLLANFLPPVLVTSHWPNTGPYPRPGRQMAQISLDHRGLHDRQQRRHG